MTDRRGYELKDSLYFGTGHRIYLNGEDNNDFFEQWQIPYIKLSSGKIITPQELNLKKSPGTIRLLSFENGKKCIAVLSLREVVPSNQGNRELQETINQTYSEMIHRS